MNVTRLEKIRCRFDSIAADYDHHMRRTRYRTPYVVAKAVVGSLADKRVDEVLDMGCGTGLCGDLLRPAALRLTGVDVSEKAIFQAQKKGAYDELEVSDLENFLINCKHKFDIIVCGGVLQYFSELKAIFELVELRLSQGGYFIFTVDKAENASADYRRCLYDKMMFSHSPAYVTGVAQTSNMDVINFNEFEDRADWNDESVCISGVVFVVKKRLQLELMIPVTP